VVADDRNFVYIPRFEGGRPGTVRHCVKRRVFYIVAAVDEATTHFIPAIPVCILEKLATFGREVRRNVLEGMPSRYVLEDGVFGEQAARGRVARGDAWQR
jgi:hypothetical protein